MARLLVTVFFLAVSLGAVATHADGPDDEALAQFQQGVELYKAGQFEQAAIAFERAYELRPSYKIFFNIGQAQNELRHYAAALEAYEKYLSGGRGEIEDKRRKVVMAEIKRLKTLVGHVSVEAATDGLMVFVDGHKKGPTPLRGPVALDLGEHQVVVKDGTDELHSEVVRVAGGKTVVVSLGMGEAGGSDSEAEVETGIDEEAGDPVPEIEEKPRRVWTWVAVGVGVAAAVGAGVTGGITLSRADDLEGNCPGGTCPAAKKQELQDAKALGNVSTALTVVAAVAVAAGIVLFVAEPGLDQEDSGVAIVPTAQPDGAGLVLVGRF